MSHDLQTSRAIASLFYLNSTMDKKVNLISGGVYQTTFSEEPCRVIAFDNVEVHYDTYGSFSDKWMFASNLKRQGTYYRTTSTVFSKDAVLLREQPLTKEELEIFRPDLPFRVCRNKQLIWTNKQYEKMDDFKKHAKESGFDISDEIVLPITTITLRPFGTKGTVTALKSSAVTAMHKEGFTAIELLWLAHNIQAIHIKKEQDKGVGIFRSGHEKKMPSYYIGQYYDMADIIPNEE